MAIELTYGDDADQQDIDRAILLALGAKKGYVVELTYATEHSAPGAEVENVVVESVPEPGWTLYCRRFDEATEGPVGPLFAVDDADIRAIKIY